jgi:CRP-like cAMP-binding protein
MAPSHDEANLTLSRAEICQGLAEAELDAIAQAGQVKIKWNGDELLHEGDVGDSMILLLDGKVSIVKSDVNGRTRELAQLGPGAVLGEIALLEDVPRTATVKALTPVRYFEITRRAFDALLVLESKGATKMLRSIARTLARRQRHANERLVALLVEATQRGVTPPPEIDRYLDELVIEWE